MKNSCALEINEYNETDKNLNSILSLLEHHYPTNKKSSPTKEPVQKFRINTETALPLYFITDFLNKSDTHLGLRSRDNYVSSYKLLTEKIESFVQKRVAEQTVELREANSDLDSFAYSVSHDLRAPLQVIKSYSSLLSKKFGSSLNDDAKVLVDGITMYSKNMSLIMDNLLKLSRLDQTTIARTVVNMNSLLQQVLEELNPVDENLKAKIKMANLNPAFCDAGLVKQVWTNLISNSIKYSSKVSHGVIEIGCTQENGTSIYFIKDNGVGFNMKYADKLFGLFNRLHDSTEFEGTGVGLNIAYRIITKHGGKIWAIAKENEGATFYFTLSQVITAN